MKINFKTLGIWMIIAFIISSIFSIYGQETFKQFIIRFSFVGFIDMIAFLTLTHFKLIR
jgi:hypothetical protein